MIDKFKQVEVLFASLVGSHRRSVNALITNIYPLINSESAIIGELNQFYISNLSFNVSPELMSGTINVLDIDQVSVVVYTQQQEVSAAGILSVFEIDQVVVVKSTLQYEDSPLGALSVLSIDQYVAKVSVINIEKPMTGSLSVDSITKV